MDPASRVAASAGAAATRTGVWAGPAAAVRSRRVAARVGSPSPHSGSTAGATAEACASATRSMASGVAAGTAVGLSSSRTVCGAAGCAHVQDAGQTGRHHRRDEEGDERAHAEKRSNLR